MAVNMNMLLEAVLRRTPYGPMACVVECYHPLYNFVLWRLHLGQGLTSTPGYRVGKPLDRDCASLNVFCSRSIEIQTVEIVDTALAGSGAPSFSSLLLLKECEKIPSLNGE